MRAKTWTSPWLVLAAAVLCGGALVHPVIAEEEESSEFDVASLYFELNDTDGDLGIHALIDGEPWKKLEIERVANEKELLSIKVRSQLRRQGLTELFFESAEPSFDELSPSSFFQRFPEGAYEIEGETLEGEELESIVELSHVLPAPPGGVTVTGVPAAADCEEGPVPTIAAPFVIDWDAVTSSHPTLGATGAVAVEHYELVVEREEPTPLKFSVILAPGVTDFLVPSGLLNSGDEVKFEILVRADNGNQTAIESCFEVF